MSHVTIHFDKSKGTINRNLYGHFTEHIGGVINGGLWVGEKSSVANIRGFRRALVESFKKIHPPIVRWPGGCFAETYDWRDGIGPREKRPTRVNWWYSCDHRVEFNQVGTHEFVDFCRMVDAEPYFAANMTTLPALSVRNWIEYCNFPAGHTALSDERRGNGSAEPFDVRYWGIGNENWGGGGQMTPEMCTREFVRYSTACNSLDDGNLKFIMCGPDGRDIEWTRRLMAEWAVRRRREAPTYGMSVHYYTNQNYPGDPINFSEADWYLQLVKADAMREILDAHRAAMDPYDPDRKVGIVVDEWGNWHRGGTGPSKGANLFEQQGNMRDAVVAAMTLNTFNNRCDSVVMANIAQLCNNLHSLYLADGQNMVETPTYHVFDMFQTHQGARQLEVEIQAETREYEGTPLEMLSASCSEKDGKLTITLVNLDLTGEQEVNLSGLCGSIAGNGIVTLLSNPEPRLCNTFENPKAVVPLMYETRFADSGTITVPAAGVVSAVIDLARR